MNEREMEEERRKMQLSSNPHHSTADLLSWSHFLPPFSSSSAANRSNQPSDRISEMLGGCKITNAEAESLNKNVSYRKNCSGHKLKEMSGSDIFSDTGNDETIHKTINHYHQDQHSQISFSGEENVTPKKPATLTEAAKQKEFSRTVETEAGSKSKKKQMSDAKSKSTSGHDIFAAPPPHESKPCRFIATTQQEVKGNKNTEESATRNLRESFKQGQSGNRMFSEENVVKSSKKIHNLKNQELTSNGIFKCDKIPPGYSEKMHSSAKLREMSGNNIFADGKSEYRDYYSRTRRPPGGESTISLV